MSQTQQLPPEWLEQIKEASKEGSKAGVWALILGSSVVAAIVSGGMNFWLASRQANVELAKSRAVQVQESLKNFDQSLKKLQQDLEVLIQTGSVAVSNSKNKDLASYAQRSIDKTADDMSELMPYIQNGDINRTTTTEIGQMLDKLGPKLELMRTDIRAVSQLRELYKNEIEAKLKELDAKIEAAAQNVRIGS